MGHAWLDITTHRRTVLWLKLAKKATGIPSVTYDEACGIALCYGWIDSRRKRWTTDGVAKVHAARPGTSGRRRIGRRPEALIEKAPWPKPVCVKSKLRRMTGGGRGRYAAICQHGAGGLQAALDANPNAARCFVTARQSQPVRDLVPDRPPPKERTRARRIRAVRRMLAGENCIHSFAIEGFESCTSFCFTTTSDDYMERRGAYQPLTTLRWPTLRARTRANWSLPAHWPTRPIGVLVFRAMDRHVAETFAQRSLRAQRRRRRWEVRPWTVGKVIGGEP